MGTIIVLVWETACSLKTTILLLLAVLLPSIWHGRPSPHLQKIEVEVENFPQLHEALAAGADAILLDNMTPEQTREAVRLVRETPGGEHLLLESSGGITLQTAHLYAEAGVT